MSTALTTHEESRELLPRPQNVKEAMELASTLSQSGLVPTNFKGKPNDIFVAMLWSHTLGIPIVQGLQYIAVINGKPSMYGDGLLAVVMASGKLIDIDEKIIGEGADAKAVCTVKRVGRSTPTVSSFSMKEANAAGLTNKPGPWKQYPKRMLKMRARSWALRDAFPDVLAGMNSAEEQRDAIDVEAHEVDNPMPAAPAPKMPRRKAVEKKAAPALEDQSTETVQEVLNPAPAVQPEPVAAEPAAAQKEEGVHVTEDGEIVDGAADPMNDTGKGDTAADLASVSDWMAIADKCASFGELNDLWKAIPNDLKETHPELKQHFTECKLKVTGGRAK